MAVASLATQIALGILLTFIATVVAGPLAGSIVGTLYSFTITAVGIYDYFEQKGHGAQGAGREAPAQRGGGGAQPARRGIVVRQPAVRPNLPSLEDRIPRLRNLDKSQFVGVQALKEIQKAHLGILRELSEIPGDLGWQHIAKHSSNPYSGFDWWMVPYADGSRQQGEAFNITGHLETLRNDPGFMDSYRAGVALIAESWGLYIDTGVVTETPQKRWSGYTIRLFKMLRSLAEFEEVERQQHLSDFVRAKEIQVLPGYEAYLLPQAQ